MKILTLLKNSKMNSLGISHIQGNLPQLICYMQNLASIKAVDIKIKTRMIGFWLNIVNSKETKLSKLLYKFLLCQYNGSIYQHKWIHCIKEILISVGRVDLLHKEVIENPKLIKIQISITLSDLYIQQWHTKVSSSSKGKTYNLFKHDINFENYLTN